MSTKRPVIVCTEHRGVFFGYTDDYKGTEIELENASMAIAFGTTKGVMELADTGPTSRSKLSARADIFVRKVSAVLFCKPAAAEAWESAA